MVNEQKEKGRLETNRFEDELYAKINAFEKFRANQGIRIGDPKALYDIFYAKDDKGETDGRLINYDTALKKFGKDSKEFEYYEYFTQTYYKLQKKLPYQFNRGLNLPSIRARAHERVAGKQGIIRVLGEEIKDATTLQADDVGFGEPGTEKQVRDHRFVPVLYHAQIGEKKGMIPPGELSYDLGNSLSAFGAMAINNSQMNTIAAELEILRDLLSNRQVAKTTGGLINTVKGKKHGTPMQRADTMQGNETNGYKQFDMYMDMVFYGMRKDSSEIQIGNKRFVKTKLADALNKYSSMRTLAFNLFSGISNVTMGKTMNFVEAHAGQHFDKKTFISAQKTYLGSMMGFLSDINHKTPKSKLGQLVRLYDGLQEYDEYGTPITGNKLWKRLLNTNAMFFMQKGGEHEIQVTLMIAFLKGKMVKTKSGKEIKLFDAYQQDKNGKLVLSDDVVDYTEEQLIKDSQKIKQVSQKLHGVYNSQDLINAQYVWAGRLAILFRKWLYPSIKRRWGSTRFNQRLESYEEGNYLTVFKFFRNVFKNHKANQVGWVAAYNDTKGGLKDWQKQNIRRSYAEGTIMLGITILIGMLAGLDDEDDERNWVENMVLFQLHRLNAEMKMYMPWNIKEALQILKSPSASMSTVEHIARTVGSIFGMGTSLITEGDIPRYTRDTGLYDEGDAKIWKQFDESIPMWKEIRAMTAPENRLKWMLWK